MINNKTIPLPLSLSLSLCPLFALSPLLTLSFLCYVDPFFFWMGLSVLFESRVYELQEEKCRGFLIYEKFPQGWVGFAIGIDASNCEAKHEKREEEDRWRREADGRGVDALAGPAFCHVFCWMCCSLWPFVKWDRKKLNKPYLGSWNDCRGQGARLRAGQVNVSILYSVFEFVFWLSLLVSEGFLRHNRDHLPFILFRIHCGFPTRLMCGNKKKICMKGAAQKHKAEYVSLVICSTLNASCCTSTL